MVQVECRRWASKGVNIRYEIRDNRVGYKAGALKMGMKHRYVKDCDYVVIFDADFQPDPDFLCRTIPFLIHNPQIGLVQGRWRFGNAIPLLIPLPADTACSWSCCSTSFSLLGACFSCKFTVVNTVLLRSKRAIYCKSERGRSHVHLSFVSSS